ncbi:uncharacterized protein LOC133881134 [Alnus glutinosa]|uniref:uncharacterized protein LOC133881134 n=1 Tax=Alnus glutinosa TaxID=3517 RepID=UPI002D78B31A|nr:uncharacterized protein LOC133881134 [Alnus glutinosa]
MGIRKELHLQKKGATYLMPIAKYTLTRDERKSLCEWLKVVKLPDGYASNISWCVNKLPGKISSMKSHDCHVFLLCLLSVAIQKFLTLQIQTTLTELSTFFNQLCARTLKVDVLKQMKEDIIMILCKLKKIFPPSYFDVMIHLAIHLPREAKLTGPVQFCWMYPIERTLEKYKKGIETRWNSEERNVDSGVEGTKQRLDVFSQRVLPFGATSTVILDHNEFAKAQWYLLNNCNDTASYMESNAEKVSKQLYHLACGPDHQTRTTENCGVAVKGEHDMSMIEYYGESKRILELRYPGPNTVYLFECDWWNIGNSIGIRTDQGFTSVNTGRKWYESDPFILACQAVQVFYLDDPKLGGNWKVVQKLINRNIYDILRVQEGDNEEDDQGIRDDTYQEDECVGGNVVHVDDGNNEEYTQLRKDDVSIAIDRLYVQLDGL